MNAASSGTAARRELARLMRRFYAGHLTNWEFEDAVIELNHHPEIFEIFWHGPWMTYSDVPEYRFPDRHSLTRENRRVVARWILFLLSDIPYSWPLNRRPNRWMGWIAVASILSGIPIAWITRCWALSALGLFVLIGTFSITDWFKRRRIASSPNWTVWPFINAAGLTEACRHPIFLSGKT